MSLKIKQVHNKERSKSKDKIINPNPNKAIITESKDKFTSTKRDFEVDENYLTKDMIENIEINLHTENINKVNNIAEKKLLSNINNINKRNSLLSDQMTGGGSGRLSNLATPQFNKKTNIIPNSSSKLVTTSSDNNKNINPNYMDKAKKKSNNLLSSQNVRRKSSGDDLRDLKLDASIQNELCQNDEKEVIQINLDLEKLMPIKNPIDAKNKELNTNLKNYRKNSYQAKFLSQNQNNLNKLATNVSKDISLSLSNITMNNEVEFNSESDKFELVESMISNSKKKLTQATAANDYASINTEQLTNYKSNAKQKCVKVTGNNQYKHRTKYLNTDQQSYHNKFITPVEKDKDKESGKLNINNIQNFSSKNSNNNPVILKSKKVDNAENNEISTKFPKQYTYDNINIKGISKGCFSSNNLQVQQFISNNHNQNENLGSIKGNINNTSTNANNENNNSNQVTNKEGRKSGSNADQLSKARLERQLRNQSAKESCSKEDSKENNSSEQFVNSYINHKKEIIRSETSENDRSVGNSIVNLRNYSRSRSRSIGKRGERSSSAGRVKVSNKPKAMIPFEVISNNNKYGCDYSNAEVNKVQYAQIDLDIDNSFNSENDLVDVNDYKNSYATELFQNELVKEIKLIKRNHKLNKYLNINK